MTEAATTQPDAVATTAPFPRRRRGLADILARPMHWLTGPILAKELRVASRRKRMYVLRLMYLVAMALIIVPIWSNVMDRGTYSGNYDAASAIYRMADLGKTLVLAIVWIQFFAVQLVTLLTMCTSISDEISRRTLGTLLTTPLNAWQLVIGKLTSRLVPCVGLLAMSLPILAMLTVFGGVKWSFVLIALSQTLAVALVIAVVTMFFSILNRRPYLVFLESLLAVGVIFAVPILIGVFVSVARVIDGASEYDIACGLATFHPVVSLLVETEASTRGPQGPAWMLPWWTSMLCQPRVFPADAVLVRADRAPRVAGGGDGHDDVPAAETLQRFAPARSARAGSPCDAWARRPYHG